MNYERGAIVCLAALLAGCSSPGMKVESASMETSSTKASQTAKEFRFTRNQTNDVKYLLALPRGYEAHGEKRWPLILFLHGAGERGRDVSKVAIHGPPKEVRQGRDLPFIIVSPQCPDGEHWSNDILLALLEKVTAQHAVDKSRIYLTGLSMGGYGAWSLGLSHPELFAAIAPICGGGEFITPFLASKEKPHEMKTLGVWAFHGAKDPVVPVEESQRMIALLKNFGVEDARLTIYPEATHDSWSETYGKAELYDWFLKHRR
jgi:predicted peptidase